MNLSMNPIATVSPVLFAAISAAGTDSTFAGSPGYAPGTPTRHEDGISFEPPKKKQKRNKPTLSCEDCVERKTKVSLLQEEWDVHQLLVHSSLVFLVSSCCG